MDDSITEGGLLGLLYGDNKEVFDTTFTAFTLYQKGNNDKINCLGKLLEHLGEVFNCKAVFAFMIENDEAELLYEKFSGELTEDLVGKLTNYCLNQKCSGKEITRLNQASIKESGLPINFVNGILILNRTFPLITSAASYIAVYFFDFPNEIALDFRTEWLGILPTLWSDTFEAKLQQFRHEVNKSKVAFNPDIFTNASKLHAWLRCSELCTLCEIAIGHVEKSEDRKDGSKELKDSLEEKIKALATNWHCCLDRCWPCDGGDGFGETEYGPLNWYLWRLCSENDEGEATDNDYLKDALNFTSKDIKMKLRDYSSKTPLNSLLDKYFLLQLHQNNEKILTAIKNNGDDNYKIKKNHFGRFMAERLSDAPVHPESMESAIWTICEYAYSVLKVDRRLHLASHLRHSARGEPSLHMMKNFYRDHFFHTIEVCQLGQILVNVCSSARSRKNQKFLNNSNLSVKDPMKKWYIASLLHDIGYGVDVCDSLRGWLEFFTQGAFHSLGKRISHVLEGRDFKDHEDSKNETSRKDFEDFYKKKVGFNEKIDKPFKDHGVMGAFHIHTLIENTKKQNKANSIRDVKDSILAIAKHNCQRIKVDYAKEPLTALLALCDTLQAWRRPQFPHFSQSPSWMMSLLSSNGQTSEPPQTTSAELLTNLKFTGSKMDIPKFDKNLVLRLVFDEAVNRDSFVFNIWLDALCNFQRVDFKKLPYNILVQIQTPAFQEKGTIRKIKQMNRLRDLAADTHMAYLDNFLEHTKEDDNNKNKSIPEISGNMWSYFKVKLPISYHVQYDKDDNPQHELLSINLKKMDGNRKFMTNSLSRFQKDLKGWKHFHEDRILVGDYSPWKHGI